VPGDSGLHYATISSQELIDAYLDGRLSRRVLVRRLVTGGVSLGAAISYAHLLSPSKAAAAAPEDFCDEYPVVDVRIVTDGRLSTLRSRNYLLVQVVSDEEVAMSITALIRRGGELSVIASNSMRMNAAGSKYVRLPLTPEGQLALQGLSATIVMITGQGQDGERYPLCPGFPAIDARRLQG
jgi:hypothetical protein